MSKRDKARLLVDVLHAHPYATAEKVANAQQIAQAYGGFDRIVLETLLRMALR